MKQSVKLVSATLLGMLSATMIAGTNAHAEDTTSKATIQALAGEDPVTPVDPEKPVEPGENDPDDGTDTKQKGPLQINYVSHLRFGNDIKITSKTVKAKAKNTKTPYFQVSDLRGTGAGWSLNVSLGNFTSQSNAAKTIKGATISLMDGKAVTSNDTDENAAIVTPTVQLTAGDTKAIPLMKATAENGRGTWVAKYTNETGTPENDKIIFEAPTNSIDANTQYEAILTWQLSDIPSVK